MDTASKREPPQLNRGKPPFRGTGGHADPPPYLAFMRLPPPRGPASSGLKGGGKSTKKNLITYTIYNIKKYYAFWKLKKIP